MPGSPVCLPVITGPTHFALIPAASMPSCFSFAPTFVALALSTHAELLAATFGDSVPLIRVKTLEEAVQRAAEVAQEGDAVLLSPACASLDMFNNFEERGRLFAQAVGDLS